jgi:hypothetical protein
MFAWASVLRQLLPLVEHIQIRGIGFEIPRKKFNGYRKRSKKLRVSYEFHHGEYRRFLKRQRNEGFDPATVILAENASLHDSIWLDDDGCSPRPLGGATYSEIHISKARRGELDKDQMPHACAWRATLEYLRKRKRQTWISHQHAGQHALALSTLKSHGFKVVYSEVENPFRDHFHATRSVDLARWEVKSRRGKGPKIWTPLIESGDVPRNVDWTSNQTLLSFKGRTSSAQNNLKNYSGITKMARMMVGETIAAKKGEEVEDSQKRAMSAESDKREL